MHLANPVSCKVSFQAYHMLPDAKTSLDDKAYRVANHHYYIALHSFMIYATILVWAFKA